MTAPRLRTVFGAFFAAACVGLAALIGVLVVLAVIDWSGAA